MNREISDLRENYYKDILTKDRLESDPIQQFRKWFNEAKVSEIPEPNAFVLSTVKEDGSPNSRVVLLKEIDDDGFVFYTNYESQKGQEVAVNPNVSMVFLWKEMERQVRVKGIVEKVGRDRTNAYFSSRPRLSRIGAYVSPQSSVIHDRSVLEERQKEIENKFIGKEEFEAPLHWGGYKVLLKEIEFWQGRPSRLHDRLRYSKSGLDWQVNRLAP